MKEIPLTQGLVAVVDDDVFSSLNEYKWYAKRNGRTFYAYRSIRTPHGRTSFTMHQQIMDSPKGVQVDHIDHNGLNNTRSNLRLCTKQQNVANTTLRSTNRSGFKGVSFHRQLGKWRAVFHLNGKQIYLGAFPTPEEAARAYDAAAVREWGEFAYPNFPVVVAS